MIQRRAKMMPIGPLMIEHRLIERMIRVMARELERLRREQSVDSWRIDTYVDFIRTYADRCHHGKEEDILFRELKGKKLPGEHKRTLEELIEEHKQGRELTRRLVEANACYRKGEREALVVIADCIDQLVNFYPRHIEKEDKRFFLPVMRLFSEAEKQAMLEEGFEFDRNLIHDRYERIVAEAE